MLAVIRKRGEAFVEHHAILEGGVHPLAVEWDNGVRGIADERDLVVEKPRRATDRDQRAGWVLAKIFEQRRHERDRIGEFLVEKATDVVVGRGGLEATRTFEFPKERAGKRAVRVRQRDHHETFPRPDVERVFFHAPGTVGRGRNRQLLVTVSQITLVVLEIRDLFLHRLPDGGERAIYTNDGVATRCDRTGARFQKCDRFIQVDAGAAVIEEDADVWITKRGFDNGGVEGRAADGIDVV